MKHQFIILFVLLYSFSIFSQIQEGTNSESIPEIVLGESSFNNKPVIDTLHIKAGKPIVFIVDVTEYPASSSHDASKKEEKELTTNFDKAAFEIKKIEKHTYIIFQNKQTLDISASSNSYYALAYWSGNMEDDIQTKEGINFATEFIAKQIDVEKESSYVINARKHKEHIATLKLKNNSPTKKSKLVMSAFLDIMLNPLMIIDETHAPLFIPQASNLKKIETYISKDNDTKIIIGRIDINKNGQPISNIRYNSRGIEKGKSNFVYKEGVLTQMIENDKIVSVYYDDDSIVLFENSGDADEIKIGRLKNNTLLLNRYLLMQENTYAHRNYSSEERIENNCVVRYFNNDISSKNCNSTANKLPYHNKNISYHGEEIHGIRNSKLEKKDKKTFEIFYSNIQEEAQKDNFKLWSTLKLNDKKLLSSYSFVKRGTNTMITFEYTYY